MAKEIAIEVNNLSKSFRLPTEKASGLKQAVINRLKGIKGHKEQKILRGISFKVEKGDFFGVVGRNGSGKSTLLKIISGIYQPSNGSVRVNGSLVSFIELGVGFNPELTGRENIYLNGALMGFSVKEIDDMYGEIVEFSELHEFMDQKLKNYSSGMQVRLAFACAIRAKSDILVLDEVLAVGDEAFQRKCNDYFDKIQANSDKTIILVTHSMASVKKYCNKAILIRNGRIATSGNSDDVADEYSLENLQAATKNSMEDDISKVDLGVKNLRVELLSPQKITQKDCIKIRLSYDTTKDIQTQVDASFFDIDRNISILYDESEAITSGIGQHVIDYECELPRMINDRKIRAYVAISNVETSEKIAYSSKAGSPFFILRRSDIKTEKEERSIAGIVKMSGKWSQSGNNK